MPNRRRRLAALDPQRHLSSAARAVSGAVASRVLSTRVEALDVFVELLSEIDTPPSRAFYDRICEAVCRVTSMERAVLLVFDEDDDDRVTAAGSHGLDPGLLAQLAGTREETPMARRALYEDRVVEVSENIEDELPPRYAHLFGLTTLTCTPLSAAGRWFGVVFADRGGGRFNLADQERHAMWTLGKMVALAASARDATRQQEEARRLAERIDLAREIHERVVQRLFGVSLVLSAERELPRSERLRSRDEIQEALADLRTALSRPLAPQPRDTGTTLREELDRVRERALPGELSVHWSADRGLPAHLEPLAQSVLAEALRNVSKHAEASRVEICVARENGTFSLEVVNDGVSGAARGTGMGLRLAAFEALQHGGIVEFGSLSPERWRVRLVVPVHDDADGRSDRRAAAAGAGG